MDAPALFPELDDQLDALTEDDDWADLAAVAESSGLFTVDSLDKANWAVAKIGQHQAQLAEKEAFARRLLQRQQERIDLWLDGERKQAERQIEFLTSLLRGYHGQRTAGTKLRTVNLPAGALAVRKSPDRVEVDGPVFLAAQPDDSPLVRTKREPDKTALLQHVKTTGERPAGVVLVEGEDRFSVKPHVEVDR